MDPQDENIPGVTEDPLICLILTGVAKDLDEAEEIYLDESLPEILELLRQPISNEELEQHPLMRLPFLRASRGWEDSIL